MLYGVFNLETGDLDYVCDEEAKANYDPNFHGFVECPSWTWAETHIWNQLERTFEPIPE